ncbi:putative helicase senataxin [Rhinoraja longicauda]
MSTCRWCTPQRQSTIEFLRSYSSEELLSQELKAANEDLCYCLECVVEYHRARDELPSAHENLWKIEIKRLVEHFEKTLKEEEEEEDELFLIEDEQEIQLHGYMAADIENDLRVPIIEILKYPYLLLHEHLSELFVDALSRMEQGNFSFQIFEKYAGIYLLLVHPNETIRKWAILAARSLGKVERDDFYDLQEVITCLLKVIELDLFENTDFYNSYGMQEGKLILLPSHLYDVTNHKNYWLGVCMLLLVLDEQAMDSLLLSHDKQNDFMKSILNTMMKSKPGDASDPFWPALQCFMVILDRLGSKVWGHLIDPTEAFQTIIRSHSYNSEIENIRNSSNNTKLKHDLDDDGDDVVSCSQIVYDYNSRKQSKDAGWKHTTNAAYYPSMFDEMQSLAHVLQCDIGQDMRVHNSTFLWFIPFVNSVMDLKDLGIAYIGEVVHHLHSEIKDVLNRKVNFCDKVTEFFILILVSIIELHKNKNYLHLLWYSSHKWVEALVKCANLPARVFNLNTERTTVTSNFKVSSTAFSVTSSACSSITNSVQQACVQLIRSFLREGCQSQQRSIFQQFLDRLNLQLRSTFILGWQLSVGEQQDLQSCLTQLVKNAKFKSSEMKQLGTARKGSELKCPLIKSEKEDTREWGKMPGYCNSGPGPPCSAFQTDNGSSVIQKNIMKQDKMATCEGQENRLKESSLVGDFSYKAELPVCDDGTFLKTKTVEANVLKVEDEKERCSLVLISPPPPPPPPAEKITRTDLPCKQRPALEQTGGLKHESVADAVCTVGSLLYDNLQTKSLEVTSSVHHKEKWKRSMLLEFQKSFNDDTVKPEATSTINDQKVPSGETPGPSAGVCYLPQKMESASCKFKIDPSKLLNLKVKLRAIDIKRKMKKENNSFKERDFPKVEVDNSQLACMNNRNQNQNVNFSKKTIAGSTSTEQVTDSHLQLSPFLDKSEQLTSDALRLTPLSQDKANSSTVMKVATQSREFQEYTSKISVGDDIPFSELRAKLKNWISLTRARNTNDSKMNKHHGNPLKVTSMKPSYLSSDLSKELDKIPTLNKIERRVKVCSHAQRCDPIQNKEKSKSDSSVEEFIIDEDAEDVTISNSQSTKDNTNVFEVERRETQNLVGATSVQETTDSTEKNETCHQEMPTSSKPLPTLYEEYDSQIFEFESEEQIHSVWGDIQPPQKKQKEKTATEKDESDVQDSGDEGDVNSMLNEWGYDTDYVPDDIIEKVAVEVEAQLEQETMASKADSEKQLLLGVKQISPCSSAGDSASVSCSRLSFKSTCKPQKEKQKRSKITISNLNSFESLNLSDKSKRQLVAAKRVIHPERKTVRKISGKDDNERIKNGISKKYLSQVSSRKGLNKFILTQKSTNGCQDQKVKKNRSKKTSEKSSSQTPLATTSNYTAKDMQVTHPSAKLSTSTPKKVRKHPEPTSAVEKLGLKKRTRKAFDLSQGSLDNLNKLRNYGQVIGTIENKHPKKAKLIVPQKLAAIRNSKLLASQDLQYRQQSRSRRHHKDKKRKNTSEESAFLKGALSSSEKQDFSISVRTSQKLPSASVENSTNPIAVTETSLERETNTNSTEAHVSSVNVSDYLNLTQHDPIDMDISTDENLEDDHMLMLTQRDPVDMDIDNDTTEEKDSAKIPNSIVTDCLYRGCTDVVVSSERFVKTHAVSEPKDGIFAKIGLPQSDLKNSRPSTAKCFASSSTSRNAQLAIEMEVIPKRPAVAVSKVQQLQTPPSVKFAVPQTLRPIQPAKAVEPNVLRTQNKDMTFRPKSCFLTPVAESCSMFAPLPPGRSRQASHSFNMTDHHQRDQSDLIKDVLKWTYQMFDMFDQFGAPDILCDFPLREVPERFKSYEEYFSIFYPLLMINLFEQLAQKLMESKQTNKMIQNTLTLKSYSVNGRVNRAEFQAILQEGELLMQLYPKEDDVVFLWLPQRRNYYMQDDGEMQNEPHIAHVSRIQRFPGRDSQTTLYLTIHTRGNVSAVDNQPVRCDVIGSIVTTTRQFKGLLFLAKTPLIRPILSAHSSFFIERNIVESTKWSNANNYNEHQQRAISTALSMVKQPRIPKVCLVQGPPGTGKSKTIVGLLHRLLNEDQENVKPSYSRIMRTKRTRILVCAPSNAAIDELMKKIIVEFKLKCKNVKNCLGNCGDVNLLRLGSEKTISTDVMGFSLDYQVNRRKKKSQLDADQVIQRQKDWLDRKLDELGKQCAIIKKDGEQIELAIQERRKLERERAELGRKQKEVNSRSQDIQLNIILESHIICCTLSTSGSMLLEMSFRKLGHEPFSCVIVDEAGQACETEILIPLMYRCPKLILVGDPEQLPPTIISMKAKELNYGQSIMSRLLKCLQNEVNQNNSGHKPVQLLLTQYRMHPDICLFPSKYIYGNRLKTDENVEMERCRPIWLFQSYMLFDVTDGFECREKDSYTNPQEMKLVVALINMIAEKQNGTCRNIGVITPYNAQKQGIINQFAQECKRTKFEIGRTVIVGTVDGFQGCEKDCIIVSCVRANSLQSIGFLADRQRMNVTITRARSSLFILGHLKTLMEDKDWNALIQDAKKRGAIVKTCEREYKKDCKKIIKPRPALHKIISDPCALTNEREPAVAPVLKKSRSEDFSLKTAPGQLSDFRSVQIPQLPIPSIPAARQQPYQTQASVSVQPEASNTVALPPTSGRSERSVQSKCRDPRLARREEIQRHLKASCSLSKSSDLMPPGPTPSSSGHGTTCSSHTGQTARNSASGASDASSPNYGLVSSTGTSVPGSGSGTVHRFNNSSDSRRHIHNGQETKKGYRQQK